MEGKGTRPCPRCEKPIAAMTAFDMGASRCPHCGYQTWAGKFMSPLNWLLLGVLALVLWCSRTP